MTDYEDLIDSILFDFANNQRTLEDARAAIQHLSQKYIRQQIGRELLEHSLHDAVESQIIREVCRLEDNND